MAYQLTRSISLGSSKAGLVLAGQLCDSTGANVGAEITTGFVELGGGNYLIALDVPDGHRGALLVHEAGLPGVVLGACAINPEEAEYLDAAVSSRSTFDPATEVVACDLQQIGGDAQSATDLKDFADTAYNPATHLAAVDVQALDGSRNAAETFLGMTLAAAYGAGYGLRVSGDLDPDVTGLYFPCGTNDCYPSFKHESLNWYLWGYYDTWTLSDTDGANGSSGIWTMYGQPPLISLAGEFTAHSPATGTATVTIAEHPFSDTLTTHITETHTATTRLRFSSGNRVLSLPNPTHGGIGANQVFLFSVSSAAAEDKVISFASSEVIEDIQVLDARKTTTRHTTATVGTQWQLAITVEQHDGGWTEDGNGDPWVEFSSSDESVATVNSEGLVEYAGEGTCTIIATSQETESSPSQSVRVAITNTTSGGQTTDVTVYAPDTVVAADHVLLLYNAESTESEALKNYYLARRPGMAAANVLGITGVADATSAASADVDGLLAQVRAWLLDHPGKPIRYLIGLRGLPSRQGSNGSVPYMLYDLLNASGDRTGNGFRGGESPFSVAQYPGATALPGWIDMGSFAATYAYLDKLKAVADAGGLRADGITVSGSDAGLAGTQWVFDEKRGAQTYYYANQFDDDVEQIGTEGIDAENVTYQNSREGPAVAAAAAPLWYASWGVYTWGGDQPDDVTFSGNAGWWVMDAVQSYGGMYASSHVDPVDAFAADAWGGTDYAHTPVGFVGFTAEPYLGGIQTRHFAGRWARGWNFAEAAWAGRNTHHILPCGDPLVVR